MLVNKWDFVQHKYYTEEVPDDWNCPIVCFDMSTIVNCINCGQELAYGETYCSRRYHNHYGLGYAVCPLCHEEEFRTEFESNNERSIQGDS